MAEQKKFSLFGRKDKEEEGNKPASGTFGAVKPQAGTAVKPQQAGTAVKPQQAGTAIHTAVKPQAGTAAKPAAASTTAVKPTAASTTAVKPTAASTTAVKPTAASTTAVKPTAASAAAKNKFTDVPADAYYAEAVAWAVQQGITTGTTDTTFTPDNPCHRGHAATFIWRSKGSPAPKSAKSPFTDVADGPFYKAILWAVENGIMTGKTDTTFAHTDPCTRGQALKYILRAEGKPQATDADAIKWAAGKQMFAGMSGNVSSPCTRADIVTFLYRAKAR